MSNLENNFSIYPYGYEDELAQKHAAIEYLRAQEQAQRAFLTEKIAHPADATARSIGDIAIQSVTGGLLRPDFDTDEHHDINPASRAQISALGNTSLRSYMHRTPPHVAITEAAVLGFADRQAA